LQSEKNCSTLTLRADRLHNSVNVTCFGERLLLTVCDASLG
jgi:hypothetical protein